jgi:serine-type D-Ala-D-Ala carboxypeptidase/endopeptidase (penicillin-binding protein 4)
MMNNLRTLRVTGLLLLTIVFSLMPPGLLASAQRERRTEESQKAARTTSRPSPSPSPVSSPTPTPIASPTPTAVTPKVPVTTKTLAELQQKITSILQKPELGPGIVGIKVVSLANGSIVFEENSEKLLRPASNMKLYTVAAALDRLSPDYRFKTSVYAASRPDSNGVIRGALTIYGRGDPTIAARFNNGDYFKAINDLASRIAAAGVKRVEGDLVGDESYFVGPKYGAGWEWEDLTWYFGAEVSALSINDNALDLSVKPGPAVGKPAVITTGPPDPLLKIDNKAITVARGIKRNISIYRELGSDNLTISGIIPIDNPGYNGAIGISHPAKLFVYLLRAALAQRGVVVRGQSRTESPKTSVIPVNPTQQFAVTNVTLTANGQPPVEIATLQSPPLSLIAAQTLKPSQNLYTELILRTLGQVSPPPVPADMDEITSANVGLEAVKSFLKTVGIRPESLVLSDGSGLSRNDMITADASVQLLMHMSKHRYADIFREALPIAGVDGTLRSRMKGTPAENNLRAKTGSLSSAASLSGYVTTAAGEKLAFSIMVNNYPEGVDPRSVCIDPIAVLLASFGGNIR